MAGPGYINDSFGNFMDAPAFKVGTDIVDDEIVAAKLDDIVQKGVTLKGGQGVLPAGQALAYDSGTKKYVAYLGTSEEVDTVSITGGPAGGTFTITVAGQTTAGIAFNATAAAVQTALEALSNVDPGDVVVTKSGSVYTLTFTNTGAFRNVAVTVTSSGASLTGGSSPAATAARITAGGADLSDTCLGFLRQRTNTGSGVPSDPTRDVFGNIVYRGTLKYDKLVNVDASAIADLNARVDTVANLFIF